MNSLPQTNADQRPFWRWIALFLVSYGIGQGILLAAAGLVLRRETHNLLICYGLLLWCGFIGACLIYWARQSYERPGSGAIRFGLAVFVVLDLYMGILVFGAYILRLLTKEEAIDGYAPYILPVALMASVLAYTMVRRRLEATNRRA